MILAEQTAEHEGSRKGGKEEGREGKGGREREREGEREEGRERLVGTPTCVCLPNSSFKQ